MISESEKENQLDDDQNKDGRDDDDDENPWKVLEIGLTKQGKKEDNCH